MESCEEGEEDGADEEEGDEEESDEVLDGLPEESIPDPSIACRSNMSAHSKQYSPSGEDNSLMQRSW